MTNTEMWLWLSCTRLASAKIYKLYEMFESVENIYTLSESTMRMTGFLTNADINKLNDKSTEEAQRIYDSIQNNNIKIITIDSPDYPESLRNLSDPPCVLYIKGKFIDLNRYASISIVGSRRPTQYGAYSAEYIAREVAKKGYIIISGLADGIDSFAHTGALMAEMPTVAVLGCGIDKVYPASNTNLATKIVKDGMLISEYPPGTPPAKHRFPERNRIIAALSLATAVIEANENSGSLITSKLALELGKDIFALPGNITSPRSKGTNCLIRDGAYIITDPDDISTLYEERYKDFLYKKETDTLTVNKALVNSINSFDSNNISQSIFDLLETGNKDFDTLCQELSLSSAELSAILLGLEIEGKIIQYALNVYGLKM
ncbi:MAG: DNA-protecting protein DprA [Ruminococcaceae bacterium]|nr:DNA-protecting protein DprA [Oscillospiraceae bacterium]